MRPQLAVIALVAVAALVALAPVALRAVTVPNTFQTGEVATAAGVNANFAAITSAVTTLETPVAFAANSPLTTVNVPDNVVVNIGGWNELFDTSSAFDGPTGVFTAPVAGYYQFNANLTYQSGAIGTSYCNFKHTRASDAVVTFHANFAGQNTRTLASSALLLLAANDTVAVACYQSTGAQQPLGLSPNHQAFNGVLLHRP